MAAKAVPIGLYADNISIASSDLVKIHVGGASPDELAVHRDVICSTSEVLKRIFASSATTETDLLHISQMLFKIYVNWLYTGIVRVAEPQSGGTKEYTLLGQLYLTGASLMDRKFKNAVISVLLKSARETKSGSTKSLPNDSCINSAYTLPEPALKPLKKALVEIYATEEDPAHLLAVKDKVDRNFLSDLSMRLMDMRLSKHKNMWEVKDCTFHEHKPKEKCEVQEPAKKRRREE